MRAYRLALLPKSGIDISSLPPLQFYGGNEIILTQNMNNNLSDNINIEFDLQQLVNDEIKECFSTSTITLYNVNRYWHNENAQNAISNAKISLCAGTKATPMLRHQGLVDINNTCYALNDSQITNRPIFEGYVANAYPDMDGASTLLRLNLVGEAFNDEVKGLIQFQINAGEKWRPKVLTALQQIILKEKLTLIAELGDATVDSIDTVDTDINPLNINGIFQASSDDGVSLQQFIKKTFNEILYKENNTIYIGKPKLSTIPAVITDKDLIGQPQMTGYKTISFNVPLTNRFRILQNIDIALGSFVSLNQQFYSQGDMGYSSMNRDNNKMFYGNYKIIQIWHKGQSRNISAESWCTTIEAVENFSYSIDNISSAIKSALRL